MPPGTALFFCIFQRENQIEYRKEQQAGAENKFNYASGSAAEKNIYYCSTCRAKNHGNNNRNAFFCFHHTFTSFLL